MTQFLIHAEHIDTGRKARFVYDNATSALTDESGVPLTIPQGIRANQTSIDKPASNNTSVDSVSCASTPLAPAASPDRATDCASHLEELGKSRRIRTLKIQLGLHCNYSCSYCNQRHTLLKPEASASTQEVQSFLQSMPHWFEGGSDDQGTGVHIEFWGGEPLVYWRLLQPLAHALRSRYPAARLSLITNGSLLDLEKNAWLDALGFCVAISHDGPGQAMRGPDPMSQLEQRMAILDLYRRLAPSRRISINALMHRGNASRADVNRWMVAHFGEEVVIGEGAFIDPYDASGLALSMPDLTWAQAYARQAFLELRSGQVAHMHTAHDKVWDFIASIAQQRPISAVGQKCGMDRPDTLAVNLQGHVLTCQNTSAHATAPNGHSHRIGHVSDLSQVRLRTATHWRDRPLCMTCPVLQLCKGSCMFLQDTLWQRSCDNAYADNMVFFAAGLEWLTGYAPVYIEAVGSSVLPPHRQDIFGLAQASMHRTTRNTASPHQHHSRPRTVIPIYPDPGAIAP